jgi:hypothetical protein
MRHLRFRGYTSMLGRFNGPVQQLRQVQQPRQLGLLQSDALVSRRRGGGITRPRPPLGPKQLDTNRESARRLSHRRLSHRQQPDGFFIDLFPEFTPCSGDGHLLLRVDTKEGCLRNSGQFTGTPPLTQGWRLHRSGQSSVFRAGRDCGGSSSIQRHSRSAPR